MGNWRTGSDIGGVYLLSKKDLQRVGKSWMEGRLKVGDVVLCHQHSGDCFNEYILLGIGNNFVEGIPESSFGAYVFGKKLKWEPTMKEFHLLMAGETLSDGLKEHPLFTELKNI